MATLRHTVTVGRSDGRHQKLDRSGLSLAELRAKVERAARIASHEMKRADRGALSDDPGRLPNVSVKRT